MSDAGRTKATDNRRGLFDTEEEWCDRRLSRAARKLVHQHLLKVVQAESSILYHGFLDQSDVWVLLEHWLHANGRRMDQCPLDPTLDAYRIDEEHSLEVDAPHKAAGAYPTFAAHQFQKGKRKRTIFECLYNHKSFISRYYLDVHLERHHKVNDLATFCPASDWCRAVGVANCHATALEEEPYYGQGSDGWGDDSNLIRHKWVKKAHSVPCNDAEIREDCHAIMDRCGITDSSQRWCDALVCPTHRLGDILSSSGWTKESECISHPVAFLVTIFGLLIYFCVYFQIFDIADDTIRPSSKSSRPVATSSSKKLM